MNGRLKTGNRKLRQERGPARSNFFKKKLGGFSIIEMLVAATVFSFLIIIVSGLYVRVLALQRRANGAARVQENTLFLIESIAREIRVSKVTSGDTDCMGGGGTDFIRLDHPVSGIVDYAYDSATGEVSRDGGILNSPDVRFTDLQFCVSGSGPDNLQTRVTLLMTAENVTPSPGDQVSFTIQTTVTSRDLVTDLTD